ncbi:MAG: recombinase RecA [Dehalococcoidia bacterium]|nr:recombinase RecA [Chloroflexota bacterium]RZP13065.1 MAG: recombinase RecA [Chloroflexota bacterium]
MANKKTVKSENKTIELTIEQIEKSFGKGAVMRMNESGDNLAKIQSISTGSMGLDIALGIGGVPRGRIVEIFGAESAGKSTLALSCLAEAQKNGGQAAYIDVEHAMDPSYAQKIGVNNKELLISQPNSAEEALEITDHLVASGALDIIVIDSVAALVPRAELEGEMGDYHIGAQARLMSQALRKLTATVHKTNTTCIFINQLREKVGVIFGSPEVTPGGRALKFYSSVRIDLRRSESIKIGEELIGNKVRVRVVKNKVAPPFKKAEIEILYNEGISKESEILDLGVIKNIIEKSGSFYSFEGERLGQGRESVRKFLKNNPDISKKIEDLILNPVIENEETEDSI